jgi:ubiquinol-cytochrome c reductase cytochrome c1 subunit
MRKTVLGVAAAILLAVSGQANASGGIELPKQDWSFNGIFGTYDRGEAQRGLQVYKEVCAGCHGLSFIYYRNLTELGYTEDQVKAFASEYEVQDGPDNEGEMFMRPAKPSDRFVNPFPNDNAARAGNSGSLPPDLSLIAEARIGGPDYLYNLMVGYVDPPAGVTVSEGMNYNAFFPGHQIAMPPPLSDEGVEYTDGTKATVAQMARDVTTFLTWASEPNMEERKGMGIKVLLFLIVFTGMIIAVKKKIWSDVH